MNTGRTARAVGVIALGAILATALAAPAMAAPRPLTMDVYVGDGCIDGYAKPNTTIKFVVRDASGTLQGLEAMIAGSDGSWFGCTSFKTIGTGDRIKVIDYDTNQKLIYTVPRVTISVDRATDVVSGKAPAGMHLKLEAADYNAPLFGNDAYDIVKHLTATGGVYSHDFSSDGVDLMAGATLEVRVSGAGGAVTLHRDLAVPGIYILLGDSTFVGYMAPYQHIGITLKVSGTQVARGDGVADDSSQFQSKFVDADDDPYVVVGGEALSAPALNISWTVPQVNGAANKATNVVTGTCFPNSTYVVETGFFGFAVGATAGDGTFSVDMSGQTNVRKGDAVLIGCATHAGDFVEQEFTVQ